MFENGLVMEFLFYDAQAQFADLGTVVFAALLTGLIGLEREYSGKPAGFRTHMLVGGASALLVLLSHKVVSSQIENDVLSGHITTDPIRVIQAIIVGVSFIGAGTVLKVEEEDRIRYLTTAASILFAAGIGIAVAASQYILGTLLVGMVLLVNTLFGRVGEKLVSGE